MLLGVSPLASSTPDRETGERTYGEKGGKAERRHVKFMQDYHFPQRTANFKIRTLHKNNYDSSAVIHVYVYLLALFKQYVIIGTF